jgi:outer membrane protein assembly factor BamB
MSASATTSRSCPGTRIARSASAAVFALVLALALAAAGTARAASSDQAVAYQLDPAHDGYQSASPITTPLSQAWSTNLGGAISYPLIVNGIVYVTAVNSGGGTNLYALNQATGATLWSHALGGTYPWSGLAYDAGQVFTVNSNGALTAFDATTGATSWSTTLPGQYSFSSPPTATNGYVYTGGAGSGGTLYAVSEATGVVAWTQSVENGDNSSPAVDSDGVYVTYACDQDYDFDPRTGAAIWHHAGPCEGGGGKTPVLANGDIFSRDSVSGNIVLSAASGGMQGSFNATPAPAVGSGTAYTVTGGSLTATNSSGLGTTQWTFTGDGKLDTAPLLVGNLVFAGSSGGNVYAINASGGTSAWSTTVASGVPAPDEQNVSQPLTGLGVGEGTLLVPTGSTLTAFVGANVGSGTPANSTPPTVSGTPVVGQPVGADVGTWTAMPTSYAYQWLDCSSGVCSNISGATGESYTPTNSQLGSTLEVSVTATNSSGQSSAVVSQESDPVGSAPVNTTAPTITGTASNGQSLSASPGTWSGSPTSYSYQWMRCQAGTCTAITGATASSYTVNSADTGSQLEVQVTAANAVGAATADSALTTTVPTGATTISLTASANPATVGSALTFSATITPSVDGGTVTFSEDGQAMSWCQGLAVNASNSTVSCAGTAVSAGSVTITVAYSGDSNFNASTASLTEQIVNPSTPPPASTPPPTVALAGTPPTSSTSPTVYYRESGSIGSTVCTIDGHFTSCDSTHAVLSHLSYGKHTFVVEVMGGGGTAHASVTWTVVPNTAPLPAPRNLKARRTRRTVRLTWSPVRGARGYLLTVTTAGHTHTYKLSGSAHRFSIRLPRHRPASVTVRAVAGGSRAGASRSVSVR